MAESIEMQFILDGMHIGAPGEYDWTARAWRRCYNMASMQNPVCKRTRLSATSASEVGLRLYTNVIM